MVPAFAAGVLPKIRHRLKRTETENGGWLQSFMTRAERQAGLNSVGRAGDFDGTNHGPSPFRYPRTEGRIGQAGETKLFGYLAACTGGRSFNTDHHPRVTFGRYARP